MVENLIFGFEALNSDELKFFTNENDLFNFFLVVVSAQSKNEEKRVEFCDFLSAIKGRQLTYENLFFDEKYKRKYVMMRSKSSVKEDDNAESDPKKPKNKIFFYLFAFLSLILFLLLSVFSYHKYQKHKLSEDENSLAAVSGSDHE